MESIEALIEERDRIKAERDQAIADLEFLRKIPYVNYCDICKNLGNEDICDKCYASVEIDFPFYEWRGLQNE